MHRTALAFLLTLASAPAFAHAFLVHADPPVGSTLATPPAALLLTYTEALEVPFCHVTVATPGGGSVQTGNPQPVAGHPEQIRVPLHITAPGKYTVTWHALSVDTHKTEGSFSFTLAP